MRTTRMPLTIASSKKSQTELLGFAVVVMLIAVGMLFVIGFYVTTPQVDSRTTYLHTLMATSMNDALLETTSTCRSLTVRELLQQCVDNNVPMCPAVDAGVGSSVTPCDYVKGFVQNRLHETLDATGYDYEYSVRLDSTQNRNLLFPAITNRVGRVGCEQVRSPLPLSGASRTIIIYLDIFTCKVR